MNETPPVDSSTAAGLFRKPSLVKRHRRFLGDVMLAGPASTSFAVVLAGGCLAALLLLAFVLEVPSRLNAPGVLLPVGGLTSVQAERSGVIGTVLVEPGSTVAAGSPLMTILHDRRLADGAGSYEMRAESTARQRQFLSDRRRQERLAFDKRLESMQLAEAALRSTLASLAERAQNARRQAELAASDHQRLKALAETGDAALRDVEPAELRLLQANATLSQLMAEKAGTHTSIERIARDMETERASFAALDLSLAMESERLADRAVELDSLAQQSIVAPVNGTLADVPAKSGDTVSAGTVLATLQRPDSVMEARLYLSSEVAGRAEKGQEAILKLPTFPSRQFGVLRGTLVQMTATPKHPGEVSLVPNLRMPVYEAKVELEKQSMEAMGRRWPLRAGLSVEGTIIETRRTLISWMLEPLIRGSGAPAQDTTG